MDPLLQIGDFDVPGHPGCVITRMVNEAFAAYLADQPGRDPDEALLRAAALVLRDELAARVGEAEAGGHSLFDDTDYLSDLAAELYLQAEVRLASAGGRLWGLLIRTGFGVAPQPGSSDWQLAVELIRDVLRRLSEVEQLELAFGWPCAAER